MAKGKKNKSLRERILASPEGRRELFRAMSGGEGAKSVEVDGQRFSVRRVRIFDRPAMAGEGDS